jgi:tetratricopeptide (TPR) repeat protein
LVEPKGQEATIAAAGRRRGGRWRLGLDRQIWRLRGLGAGTLSAIGDRRRDERDFAAAANAYGAALRSDPAMTAIWVQYGHALKEIGCTDKALAAYGRAIALAPEVADTHLQIGHAYKIARRFRASREAYARALALDPELDDARRELNAFVEIDTGHMRRAIQTARRGASSTSGGEATGWVVANGPFVLGAGVGLPSLEAMLVSRKGEPMTAFMTIEPDAATLLALSVGGLERVVIAPSHDRTPGLAFDAAPFSVERGLLADELQAAARYPVRASV